MSAPKTLTFGFSPCPNDTFILGALVLDLIPSPLTFNFYIEDVETLNLRALSHALDVSKLSFGVFGYLLDHYQLLPVGAALGFGCGPLLVGKGPVDLSSARVAVPGRYTTAYLLLRCYAPELGSVLVRRYDEVIPAVVAGEVDAGLIIHEGRFVYAKYGLQKLADLGAWWEEHMKAPIPLGGIFIKRSLPPDEKQKVVELIFSSLVYAQKHREKIWPFIRDQAQELEDQVISKHIATYVNEFSLNLGPKGLEAVHVLLKEAWRRGIFPSYRDDFFWGAT